MSTRDIARQSSSVATRISITRHVGAVRSMAARRQSTPTSLRSAILRAWRPHTGGRRRGGDMLAYDYPLLGVFWTMMWIFLWVVWIFLLIRVFADIFRSHDMGGW